MWKTQKMLSYCLPASSSFTLSLDKGKLWTTIPAIYKEADYSFTYFKIHSFIHTISLLYLNVLLHTFSFSFWAIENVPHFPTFCNPTGHYNQHAFLSFRWHLFVECVCLCLTVSCFNLLNTTNFCLWVSVK